MFISCFQLVGGTKTCAVIFFSHGITTEALVTSVMNVWYC